MRTPAIRSIVTAGLIVATIAVVGARPSAAQTPPTATPAQPTQPTQPTQPEQTPQPATPQPTTSQPATQPPSAPPATTQPAPSTPPAPATPPATTQPPAPTATAPLPPRGSDPATMAAALPNSGVAPNVEATAVESFYRLQPSDIVLVQYRYTPEYNATVAIRPDGYITLPLIGEVRIGTLTVANAQREIVKQASVRLREPEVTVEIKDFQKPRFVVGGEVAKPGQFELRGRVTVLEAMAMAGGLKTTAKHSQIVLFRRYDEQRAVTRVINAKELAKAGAVDEDPVLVPGDFLFVPQNRISKVERFIPMSSIGWILNVLVP